MIQAIHILRNGLPPEMMLFTPPTMLEMTLDELIEAIIRAKVMAYVAQAAARAYALEDGDDYCPLSLAANDNDYHPLTPVDDACVGGPAHHGDLEESILAPSI